MIKSVKAINSSTVVVEFIDGRVHEIEIQNLDGDEKNIEVKMQEFLNGELIRTEPINNA